MSPQKIGSWVVVGLLVLSGSAQAALTVYTNKAAFLAAVSAPGVDTYTGFSITGSTPSPIVRSAGAYTYTATVSPSAFFGAGTTADPWLSTNTATDTITFLALPANVRGIGGNFFGSNISGSFTAGDITLVASDTLGATSTQTIVGATISSFLGFVSNAPLTSLTVTAVQPPATFLWPTVNDFTLAAAGAAPPALVGASSRKTQGAAGTFNLPLTP